MKRIHSYDLTLKWTGNKGAGTKTYTSYERSYDILKEGKQVISASSDPAFRGDPKQYNPEEFLLASISSCHMLWYLHLCSVNQIIVTTYTDHPTAKMKEDEEGRGRFTEVVLSPYILIKDKTKIEQARKLHHEANRMCFIANSCNFPILHEPVIEVA